MVHTQIFEMCNYGNGFTMMELYTMPIKFRRFYYNKLLEAKTAERKSMEKAKKVNSNSGRVRIRK
jgi:hypothetical protein